MLNHQKFVKTKLKEEKVRKYRKKREMKAQKLHRFINLTEN